MAEPEPPAAAEEPVPVEEPAAEPAAAPGGGRVKEVYVYGLQGVREHTIQGDVW